MHVCEGLLVLSVLGGVAHLRERDSADADDSEGCDDVSWLHCGCAREGSCCILMLALLAFFLARDVVSKLGVVFREQKPLLRSSS